MRRSRIKAVATVPVRRKVLQDGAPAEVIPKVEVKEPEKPPDKQVENNGESTPAAIEIAVNEKTIAPTIPEIIPISQVKKEAIENKAPNPSNEAVLRNEIQPPTEIVQKPSAVEGSPMKTIPNRSCFMRPTPRLDGGGRIRRNSIQGSGASASESEDDSRRSNSIAPSRVRNDSICSIQSLKETGNVNNIAKLNLGQKRRMVVSESARKLAEARREFLLKHENKCPDKSKLTMYDLIYYNPTTNPMKPKPTTARPPSRKISICSTVDKAKEDEESVDEPAEMIVPQVKVGPNGQLIIDEQSLVIDQYKAQENIDRSDIIVDEDTSGNGFYKRRQKSKDWSKWETLKFYKALNTYGTDFLLMQSIFPKRTRQELKLKYKKEERLNHSLVEKALVYQEFDTEALEKDLANVEENERKESELSKVKKDPKPAVKKKRKRCQRVADEVNCLNDYEKDDEAKESEQSSDEMSKVTIAKKVRKRPVRKHKVAKLSVNNCDKDNTDSETEVYKEKPTRSGRTSRKTKKSKDNNDLIKTYDVEEKEKNIKKMKVDKNSNQQNNCKTEGNIEIVINDLPDNENIDFSQNLNTMESSDILKKIINGEVDQAFEPENDKLIEVNQNEILDTVETNANVPAINDLDEITDDINSMANLKPGSLVVLKKDSADEPGKTTLQVYVVSADYDVNNPNYKDSLLPINLSPDELETVTNCINDIEPQNISEEYIMP